MSFHHHTLHVLISFGGKEVEIPAAVDYAFTPGHPATGPSYASGGEPADPPEVQIHAIELTVPDSSVYGGILKLPAPGWLCDLMHNDDSVFDQLVDAVPDGPDPDDERDRRRDDAMERGYD